MSPEHVVPFVNLTLLLAVFAFLLVKSRTWTGPPQDARLSSLEKHTQDHRRRLEQLEGNQHSIDLEMSHSIDSLADEIHSVCDRLNEVMRRGQKLEDVVVGMKEDFESFRGAGCGADNCPRRVPK